MHKKFVLQVIVITIILLMGVGVFVWIIDPFVFYHKPMLGLKITQSNQEYQNPGLIKNLDYETALVGTSMTENFRVSEVNAVFETEAAKICKSGAYSKDIALLLEGIIDEGKADTIILGLDANILIKPYDGYRSELPTYLYNDNCFDDVNYLLNKTVLFEKCYNVIVNDIDNLDNFYIRDMNDYSKAKALSEYTRGVTEFVPSKEEFEEWATKNIDNILPVIEKNTDISFQIFIPPYSVLFWDRYVINDAANEELNAQEMLLEQLVKCENVEVYYFMNDYEIITNLDNYKDAGHYSPYVCSLMLEKMKNKEFLVTEDNYQSVIEEMRNFVQTYDFDSIFIQ